MTTNKRRSRTGRRRGGRTALPAAALAYLSFQSAADGHGHHGHGHHGHGGGLRHRHRHRGPLHDEAEEAGHYDHRELSSLGVRGDGNVTDVFEGCMLACYGDVVERYGRELAERMRSDGFHFEPCEDDDDAGAGSHGNETEQSRALKRILGATNHVHRLWNKPEYRSAGGRLEIPYAVRPGVFGAETHETIASAISYVESATGVLRFVPRTTEAEYVHFNTEPHYAGICAANLGRQTNRPTNIYLGWCKEMKHRGSVVHEMLHALGFWHEHSRPDRDEHVRIEWENIVDGAQRNFNKAVDVDVLGTEYDFGSIMHYPDNGFSVQYSTKKTIVPVEPLERWESMGQRVRLSDHDVREMRKLYQCRTGPRAEGLGVDTLCSADCPCWEHAPGNCGADDECMDDLVCRPSPGPDVLTYEPVDQLPHFESAPAGTQIRCNDYCHPGCCGYANNVVLCPVTCDTAPPRPDVEMPDTMCVRDDGNAPASTTVAATEPPTGAPTGSATYPPTAMPSEGPTDPPTDPPTDGPTEGATEDGNVWWYSSVADKCVAFCDGPPPCGGFSGGEKLYRTVRECCDAELSYMPFDDCHTIPDGPGTGIEGRSSGLSNSPTGEPTRSPTGEPTAESTTAPPSAAPSTEALSDGPTEGGTTAVPTWPPTPAVPTYSPTVSTGAPTLVPSLNPAVATTTTTTSTTTSTTTTSTEQEVEVFQGSGDFYMDWDLQKCVRDCVGPRPCRDRRRQSWETGYATVEACCATVPYLDDCSYMPAVPKKKTMAPRSGSTETDEEEEKKEVSVWYPGGGRCLNDGLVPSWQVNRYSSRETCCRSHFSWSYDNCMEIKPRSTRKWFVDWHKGKCVMDCDKGEGGSCGGAVPGGWITTHDSAGKCCRAHMSYLSVDSCRYDSSS